MTPAEDGNSKPGSDQNISSVHQLSTPASVLQAMHGSRELVGDEIGSLTLSFEPSLSDVEVHFKFDNQNIKIECEGEAGEDCTFKFRFGETDKRQKTFAIRARSIEKESDEPIDVSFKGEDRQSLGPTKRYWIKLRPGVCSPPTSYNPVAWLLFAWCLGGKYHVRYLLVSVVIIAFLFVFHIPPTGFVLTEAKHLGIRVGVIPPYPYTQSISEPFNMRSDNRPNQSLWQNLPADWKLVNGEVDNGIDGALVVSGSQVGLIRLPALFALFDYHVIFRINVSPHQRSAAWVLRASEDNYYLFRLTFPTNESEGAKLEGFVYQHGKQLSEPLPITNKAEPISYHPFEKGILRINIDVTTKESPEVRTSSFEHTLTLDSVADEDPNIEFVGRKYTRIFGDIYDRCAYGSFGFKGEGVNNDLRVESLDIDKAH